jgi:hypothetical protein
MARHTAKRTIGGVATAMLLGVAAIATARTASAPSIATMTRSSARVFRGHCVRADVETANVGGARLTVTRYTFQVGEHLKGRGGSVVTFRQLGLPSGGARDLATLVGVPRYTPGAEYVLFLLPESGAGLTSPAGAAAGAFVVRDGSVIQVGDPSASGTTPTYENLRRQVLDEVRR